MARTSRTTPIVAEDPAAATGLTIDAAIDSYRLSLRAGNKSPATIKTYLAALAQFSRFLTERGMPRSLRAIRREHVEAFVVSLQDAGQRPATVSVAYRSLQAFFKWALGEDEIAASPMERMTPPIVPEEPPAILRASAPVPTHLRPPLARRRRQRGRPHAPRRLEEPADAQPRWRLRGRRAGARCLPAAQSWRSDLIGRLLIAY